MRKNFLDFILCPICRSSTFEIQIQSEDNLEIREGQLQCKNCQTTFDIKKGILFFDKNISPAAQREKLFEEKRMEAQRDLLAFQDDGWLLNLSPETKLVADNQSQRTAQIALENALMALDYFHWPRGARVLDLGAGKCWLTAKLAENCQCVALDILVKFPQGLEAADIFIKHKNVFFERVAADMRELPFKDNSFDIVVTNNALHHSPNLPKTVKEIYRVLSAGGQLILLGEPCVGWFGGRARKEVVKGREEGINENRCNLREWTNTFKTVGFNSYKIYLPFNFLKVLKTRGGVFKILGFLYSTMPSFIDKIIKSAFTEMILTAFDGFFNAVLKKDAYLS